MPTAPDSERSEFLNAGRLHWFHWLAVAASLLLTLAAWRFSIAISQPWILLGGGLAITGLLLSLFVLLSRANRRAVRFADSVRDELLEQIRSDSVDGSGVVTTAQAKDEFLTNMSHELRTPLNAIIGLTEVMLSGDLSTRHRRHAEVILDASESLQQVVEDMLDLGALKDGQLSLDRAPLDLHQTLEQTVQSHTEAAREKNLTLGSFIDRALPRYRLGDRRRFCQVLDQLLGNAIKFTDRGAVELRAEPVPGQPAKLRIHIRDTGPGIDAVHQVRILRAFEKVDASSTRQHGGTGVGLPLSAHLIEQMGGQLEIESRLGEGSVFHFTASLDLDPARRDEAASASPDEPLLRGEILLVEDSVANQMVVRAILGSGPSITVASSGSEALAILAERDFDLILMDLQMPEMDGLEATERLRNRESTAGRRTPIVAVTAHALSSDRERCLAAGMDAFLAKPVRRDDLLRVVGEVMTSASEAPPGRLN